MLDSHFSPPLAPICPVCCGTYRHLYFSAEMVLGYNLGYYKVPVAAGHQHLCGLPESGDWGTTAKCQLRKFAEKSETTKLLLKMKTNRSCDMALPEQKGQKSFGLHDSRDMLEKLRWELSNLFCRQRHDIVVCQYHAFNCAVTAWHVTDWLWQDISPELRATLKINQGKSKLKDFQNYAREACPALKICEQIANGSKHCLLIFKPDSTITAKISEGEGYDYGNPIIVEGTTHHMAEKIFYDALSWFEAFFRDWKVFPEEPFVPIGDP